MVKMDCAEAIRTALMEEMERDETIVVFGEDVAKIGGLFGCTLGLLEKFGEKRVRDTPISEAAIIGLAVGAAITGLRPVCEIMFVDFIGCGMEEILNQLAKLRYMSGGQLKLPVVVRTTVGSRYPFTCGAAQHSQSLEALFMHIPGLKIVTFSTPYDAKGLLKTAIKDDDPVLFFEHKLLYYARRALKLREQWPLLLMEVPEEDYTIPFGVADVKRKGNDVTVVATQLLVHKALNVAEKLSREGIEVEVIDPRTLVPLDKKTIIDSVKKTGRVVVAHEGHLKGGITSEITSVIVEEAFDYLDAPIVRVGAKNTPIPFSPPLEEAVIPQEGDLEKAIRSLL